MVFAFLVSLLLSLTTINITHISEKSSGKCHFLAFSLLQCSHSHPSITPKGSLGGAGNRQDRQVPSFPSSSKASFPHWLQGSNVVRVVIVIIYHKNVTLSSIVNNFLRVSWHPACCAFLHNLQAKSSKLTHKKSPSY